MGPAPRHPTVMDPVVLEHVKRSKGKLSANPVVQDMCSILLNNLAQSQNPAKELPLIKLCKNKDRTQLVHFAMYGSQNFVAVTIRVEISPMVMSTQTPSMSVPAFARASATAPCFTTIPG